MSGAATNASLAAGRLGAVLAKEFVQMRRDRITFAMMLVVPIIQLLLFGYAINNDPKGLPAAVLALGQDRYTRAVVAALEVSGYYRFGKRPQSAAEAESLMARGAISFLVTIPSDFGTRVERGDEPRILVEADATDPAASSNAVGALQTIAGRALTRALGTEELKREQSESALSFVVHRRYNPEGITQYNIVPGLLGVILQMTMVMMTAMALTREIERGTMENLLAMPATPGEIMLGKVLPYLAVGSVQVAVVLSAAKLLFGVPFLGSLTLLLACVLVFVLALVLLGYTISTMARTQLQAMQLTFFFFLPSLLLSGFMFPYAGMPDWAQWLGEIFPLTHFLRVVRAIMLKGADLGDIGLEVLYLSLFVPLYAGIALMRFRSTLD
ncbi:ABC transporter permease [Bosea sp. (in: a-proteobacteria)]|uniref:ABC transporter permease n=1 Tax=Bosea sp. (in: a-proteobacteria) TaxID=1871050 RepID=UPI002FCB5C94